MDELPAYDLEVERDPDSANVLEIPGACRRLTSELPQRMWETAATFDPETGELVHHGGHVTYEQSSYTYLYHPEWNHPPCEATTDTAASLFTGWHLC